MKSEEKGLTHMRIQREVQVLAEVSCGTAAPVLKDVQVGLSLILRGEKREPCHGGEWNFACGAHSIIKLHFFLKNTQLIFYRNSLPQNCLPRVFFGTTFYQRKIDPIKTDDSVFCGLLGATGAFFLKNFKTIH